MKKIVLAVAIAMAGAWGIFQANQNNNLSELQMENVELLAQAEAEDFNDYCKTAAVSWYCEKTSKDDFLQEFLVCNKDCSTAKGYCPTMYFCGH